jgi:mersacidin/lichenicidin family type 2 lantibiotic
MNREQIIRAWKDEEYRAGLSESERALLPENPAGIIELADEQLGMAGGEEAATWSWGTIACCKNPTWTGCTWHGFSTGCCEIAPNQPG